MVLESGNPNFDARILSVQNMLMLTYRPKKITITMNREVYLQSKLEMP